MVLALLAGTIGCGARSELQVGDWPADATPEASVDAPEDTPDVIDVPPPPSIQLVAGSDHTCHLRGSRLRCWGYGRQGQLGRGSTVDAAAPIDVPLADVVEIAAGEVSTAFLKSNGDVLYAGQDEQNARNVITSPVVVANGAGRLVVHAFGRHHCFEDRRGQYWCWGNNAYGQVTTVAPGELPVLPPIVVDGLMAASSITIGQFSTCAAFNDEVRCVGFNQFGQLGDGTLKSRADYQPVVGLGAVKQVAAGLFHTCTITNADRVLCWGLNKGGQLGDGTTEQRTAPVMVSLARSPIMIRPGGTHTCALLLGGTVACWGSNDDGQLGNGTTIPSLKPVPVPDVTDAIDLVVGDSHACVRRADETVWCWGRNDHSQLGDGTTIRRLSPVRVAL